MYASNSKQSSLRHVGAPEESIFHPKPFFSSLISLMWHSVRESMVWSASADSGNLQSSGKHCLSSAPLNHPSSWTVVHLHPGTSGLRPHVIHP